MEPWWTALLACPRCKRPVSNAGESSCCANDLCELSRKESFRRVDGVLALVDFDHSVVDLESLLANHGASPVARGLLTTTVKRLVPFLFQPSAVKAYSDLFAQQLRQEASRTTVLIIGGATQSAAARQLAESETVDVVSIDVYIGPSTDLVADAHDLPFLSESLDAVLIESVLEHVLDPSRVVEEIHRVLKPGGLVMSQTPFLQQVHEGAFDFTRFTESGHRHLYRKFEVLQHGVVGGPGVQLLWTLDYTARAIFRSRTAGKLVKLLFFWARFIDVLVPSAYAVDAASAFYLLARKSDRVLTPANAVAFYRGADGRRERSDRAPARSECWRISHREGR